jgi:hypothetical protein
VRGIADCVPLWDRYGRPGPRGPYLSFEAMSAEWDALYAVGDRVGDLPAYLTFNPPPRRLANWGYTSVLWFRWIFAQVEPLGWQIIPRANVPLEVRDPLDDLRGAGLLIEFMQHQYRRASALGMTPTTQAVQFWHTITPERFAEMVTLGRVKEAPDPRAAWAALEWSPARRQAGLALAPAQWRFAELVGAQHGMRPAAYSYKS